MLNLDIIQPSRSPWVSLVILVEKKDGGVRFFVDYRKLNDVSKFDAYPMPEWNMCWRVWDQPPFSLQWICVRDIGRYQWKRNRGRRLHLQHQSNAIRPAQRSCCISVNDE